MLIFSYLIQCSPPAGDQRAEFVMSTALVSLLLSQSQFSLSVFFPFGTFLDEILLTIDEKKDKEFVEI